MMAIEECWGRATPRSHTQLCSPLRSRRTSYEARISTLRDSVVVLLPKVRDERLARQPAQGVLQLH